MLALELVLLPSALTTPTSNTDQTLVSTLFNSHFHNARPPCWTQHAHRSHCHLRLLHCLDSVYALRRRGPRPALLVPPPRLGHPHPCDPDHPLHHRRRLFPVCRHDQEQPQEGSQGAAEEGVVGDTLLL